jgi:uncharacterized protein YukE
VKDGFSTDHEALARHAADFPGLAERAGSIAGELNQTLDALGTPWGDDEVGQSFSAVHSGPSQQTRAGLAGTSGHLDDMGTRLTTMAAAYENVDTDAATRIGKV